MNKEVLERLLMDRAVGELPPDVEVLLEDHLDEHPEARKEAVAIGETVRLARQALAGQPAEVLPAREPAWYRPSWAWGMAACFVGGLCLGLLGARGGKTQPAVSASLPNGDRPMVTTVSEPGFWSARRFRVGLSASSTKTERPVIWKSPIRKPELL